MMNPSDMPRHMIAKELASGSVAYYWNPHNRLLVPKDGKPCPLTRRALKNDYGKARDRAVTLNLQLDFWRVHGRLPDDAQPKIPVAPGSFDHMLTTYKAANPSKRKSYANLDPKTQKKVDYLTKRVADHVLIDGDRVGSKMVAEFDPPFVDALYEKLVVKPGKEGELRRRTTNEVMAYCRRAWAVAHRATPNLVPQANPFARMGLDHSSAETVPASYDQLVAFEAKAAEMDEPVLAFVARAAWELLLRIEEICERFAWTHWRPTDRPDHVFLGMEKNDSAVWKPVKDPATDEPFYAELEMLLGACPKLGPLVCSYGHRKGPKPTKGPDKRAVVNKAFSLRLLYRHAAAVRVAAGLPAHVTLGSFRHGGLTELGDGGLPDTLAQAQSRHRKRETLTRYIHRTDKQIIAGSRLRLAHRRGENQ